MKRFALITSLLVALAGIAVAEEAATAVKVEKTESSAKETKANDVATTSTDGDSTKTAAL